jgi:hypothetical protein
MFIGAKNPGEASKVKYGNVTDFPCQAWFESSLGDALTKVITVCGEGIECLTPLTKRTETLRRREVVFSKTELSAGNMAPTVYKFET